MNRAKAAFVLPVLMFALQLALPVLSIAQQPQAMCRETLEASGRFEPVAGDRLAPLHLAAGFGQRPVAELLLTMGADAGDTPLHAAAYWGQLGVVIQLVEFGADPGACNKDGLTPIGVAEK